MSWIVGHFVSGSVFFTGTILMVVAGGLASWRGLRLLKAVALLLAVTGYLFAGLSATPLPGWYYGTWAGVIMVWATLLHFPNVSRGTRLASGGILALATVVAAGWELPHVLPPHLPPIAHRSLYVIGDSLSADLKKNQPPWPQLLADRHHVQVMNLAQPGATVQSALTQAGRISEADGLVVLEIGGNDLLGQTPPREFHVQLERLLQTICRPGRTAVMLELPLPPFANAFGHAQRQLAKQFGVVLIPKRYFAQTFRGQEATVDGLHYSALGDQRMATMLWRFLGPALTSTGN